MITFVIGKITASNTTELTFPDSLQQLFVKSTGQFNRIIIQNIVSSLRQGVMICVDVHRSHYTTSLYPFLFSSLFVFFLFCGRLFSFLSFIRHFRLLRTVGRLFFSLWCASVCSRVCSRVCVCLRDQEQVFDKEPE